MFKNILNKAKNNFSVLWEKGAFHIIIGNFLSKFVAFFGSIFIARILTKNQMGILSYIENLSGYGTIFMGLGLSNSLLRYSVLSNDIEKKYAYFRFIIRKSMIIDCVIILIINIINFFYPHPENFSQYSYLVSILIISLPFQDLIINIQTNERAFFDNNRFAVLTLIYTVFLVLARIIGAKLNGVQSVIFGVVISYIVIGLAFLLLSWKKRFKGIEPAKLEKNEKQSVTIYGFQYMITNGLWSLFLLTNIFLMGRLSGDPVAVADYKIANTFPANMSLFSGAIGMFITPYFVKHSEDFDWIRKNYLKSAKIIFSIMMTITLGLIILAKPIIWIFGDEYTNTISLMRWLSIGYLIDTGIRYPIANVWASLGEVRYNLYVAAIGLITQITLNYLLIPQYGAYAIAYSTIFTQSIMSIILFIKFNNKYKILKNKN